MKALPKLLALVLTLASMGAGGFFLWQSWKAAADLPPITSVPEEAAAPEASAEHGGGEGGEHGAPAGGEHGGAAGAVAPVKKGASLVSLDEVFVNVNESPQLSHSLALKVELELFEESMRKTVDQRQAVVKSTVIETTRAQDYAKINTLPGKLYFKEMLISRINQALGQAAIRDLHFSSFYLQ